MHMVHDLHELILKCRDERSRAYIREASPVAKRELMGQQSYPHVLPQQSPDYLAQ